MHTTTTAAPPQDEVDFRDLMSLNAPDKSSKSQLSYVHRHICGLIEVEPLHFTCHATSDGTRMERMDAGQYFTNRVLHFEMLRIRLSIARAIPFKIIEG